MTPRGTPPAPRRLELEARLTTTWQPATGGCPSKFSGRPSVLVTLRDESGHLGLGEATPLAGFTPETTAAARDALLAIDGDALASALAPGLPPWLWLARAARHLPRHLPTARFALETALLDLLARRAGLPAHQLLQPTAQPAAALPLATLLPRDHDPALARAEAALQRGGRCFKLKVGPDPDSALCVARELRRLGGAELALRFDANQCLSPSAVAASLGRLAEVSPEFVEEPFAPAVLASLTASPCPLALDESLHPHGAWQRQRGVVLRLPVVAVVLKPAALGGLSRALRLALQARALGLDCVVSHLMDGPVARAACASLALAVGTPGRAQGLALDPELGFPEIAGLDEHWLRPTTAPGLGIDREALA